MKEGIETNNLFNEGEDQKIIKTISKYEESKKNIEEILKEVES
jgi:hypothetical protein